MASKNIDIINQQLETLKTKAEQAEVQIKALTNSLRNMIQSVAKGGVPTDVGIDSFLQRFEAGTAAPSPRVGGGAKIPASEMAKVEAAINRILTTRLEQQLAEYEHYLLSTRAKQLGTQLESEYMTKNIQRLLDNIQKYVNENIDNYVEQKLEAIQRLRAKPSGFSFGPITPYSPMPDPTTTPLQNPASTIDYDVFRETLKLSSLGGISGIPIPDVQFDKIIKSIQEVEDRYISLGQNIRHLTPSVKEIDGEFQRFVVTIENSARQLEHLNFYVDRAGDIFTQSDIDLQKEIRKEQFKQEQLERPISFMDPTTRAAYDKALDKEVEGYKKLGLQFARTKTEAEALTSGYIKFTNTMSSSTGIMQKVNLYLSQQNEILSEAEWRTVRAAEAQYKWNEAQISMGMSPVRSSAALKEAAKMQFGIEHLKKIYTQEPSGVTFLNFERWDEITGIMYKGQVAIDRVGGVLNQTNRRLLSFTDSIIRNTVEVFKWSVGATLVYQGYFKLGDLIRVAIDNQTRLADVTISLGKANRDLASIFEDVALVAGQTGESINDVLETYTMAYRAVGSATNDIERTTAANRLLYDATVLNKLSALDASSAIDVLSGALRQLARAEESTVEAFDRGGVLLDKWVALTRRANVDLATLATAFSITAESGLNAGASMEEINAVIASLSEKIGGLGGRETGNAVRALIGGVYQKQAADALSLYSIAVDDVNGKTRSFLEISRDIFEMWKAGIIDETQLNKLAYTLGGGVRRGQQYVAFLKDYVRIQELVTVQADVNREAQEALGRKLDTVQTSITRVGNAFQSLAQTMGDSGGILGVVTALLTIVEKLITRFNGLSSAFGSLAIPATLASLTKAYTTFGGPVAQERVFGGQKRIAKEVEDYIFKKIPTTLGLEAGIFSSKFIRQGGLLGLGLTIPTAVSRFGQGQTGAGFADLAGSIGGAVIGTLTGAGPVVGSILGTAIAEQFIQTSMDMGTDNFQDLFSTVIQKATEEAVTTPTDQEKLRIEAERAIYQEAGFGSEFLGRFSTKLLKKYIDAVTTEDAGWFTRTLLNRGLESGGYGRLEAGDKFRGLTELQVAQIYGGGLSPETLAKIEEAKQFTPVDIDVTESAFTKRQEAIKDLFDEYLDKTAEEFRKSILTKLIAKEMPKSGYVTALESSYAIEASATRVFTALSVEGSKFNETLEEIAFSFEEVTDLMINASEEDRQAISQLTTSIMEASVAIQELEGTAPGALNEFMGEMLTAAEITEIESENVKYLIDLLNLLKQTKLSDELTEAKQKLPQTVGAEGIATPENIGQLETLAESYQQAYYDALVSQGLLTSAQAEGLLSQTEPILVYMGKEMGYYLLEGLTSSNFFQEAMKSLLSYDFMSDVTYEQFQSVLPQYEAMKASIEAMGGMVNEVMQLVFFAGMTTPVPLEYDWKIIQFLLSQLLESSKEQERLQEKELELEGVYNLPGGATFYVPWEAWAMQGKGEGEEEGIEAAADSLEEAAEDLRYAAEAILESLRANRYGLTPEELQELWRQDSYQEKIKDLYEELFPSYGMEPGYQQDPTPSKLQEILTEVQGIRMKMDQRDYEYWPAGQDRPTSAPTTLPSPLMARGTQVTESEGLTPFEAFPNLGTLLGSLTESIESLINTIKEWNPFSTQEPQAPETGFGGEETYFNDMNLTYADMAVSNANLTVPLDATLGLVINFNSSVQLVVNGAVLAEAVRPYLYDSLVAFQNGVTTATQEYTFVG